MDKPSKEEIGKALDVVKALAEAIATLGEVPSGHLYAQVMGQMSLEGYNKVINLLKGAKLVSESNHVLTWIGPAIAKRA